MKYTLEIEINQPRRKVIELFDKPENMKHWQEGWQSFEPISGTPGQPGAKSKITYQMGKRKVELVETILSRNLPDSFSGTYETKGMWNSIENQFHEVGENKTRWIANNEFKAGGMMKLMLALMPGAFKKRSLQMMEAFKNFAEGEQT